MPVIKKENVNLNQVSAIRINQIEQVSGNPVEEPPVAAEQNSGKKYSDVVMARLTPGKRNIFKGFFSTNGITMNSGIEMCIEYVMDQVKSGNLTISKAGIK
ncbi:MAG: hypothetical protein K5751_13000 [Treponemataceae bacterium]|nr:hypothetical protein [Treponemataceae bacterium]